MSDDTFTSGGTQYEITIYPAPTDGKTHAMILVLHGNAGLNPPFGSQIQSCAKSVAGLRFRRNRVPARASRMIAQTANPPLALRSPAGRTTQDQRISRR
jgi:hypothetical protein